MNSGLLTVCVSLILVVLSITVNPSFANDSIAAAEFKTAVGKFYDDFNALIKALDKKVGAASAVITLVEALKQSPNKDVDSCKHDIPALTSQLDIIVGRFENNECRIVRSQESGCYPPDVLAGFVPNVRNSLEHMKELSKTDNNSNRIPDVCDKENKNTGSSTDVESGIANAILVQAFNENLDDFQIALDDFYNNTFLSSSSDREDVETFLKFIRAATADASKSIIEPKLCKTEILESLHIISKTLKKYKGKTCKKNETPDIDPCIPLDLFKDKYSRLKEVFSRVLAGFRTDDDSNKIPDVCESTGPPVSAN